MCFLAHCFPVFLPPLLLCHPLLLLSLPPCLLCDILHFAMVTTADPEHLSHLHHFIQYLIGSFQIKRSNCVYKSPLGFQALFLGFILPKSHTHTHGHTHTHIRFSWSWGGLFLITFNARTNKQTVDWFSWARLYVCGVMIGWLSTSAVVAEWLQRMPHNRSIPGLTRVWEICYTS